MKLIKTREAAGHILCHDITQIIKDEKKGPIFRKGHVIREEDIPVLLSVGKENLYIWEQKEGMLHENDGARRLYALCENENIYPSKDIKEGKIEAFAACDGLFRVDVKRLAAVNMVEDVMIAARHTNTVVKKGDKLAGMRVIPLCVDERQLEKAEEAKGEGPLMEVKEFHPKKVGIVTTGSEVFKGRIQDTFGPVLRQKLGEYDTHILGQTIVDDGRLDIKNAIEEFLAGGADMVVCTGGMSVDPDDRTPGAIRETKARVVTYGAPVLPGAMMMLAYYNDNIPIVGLPGCVMYAKRTIFDMVLPRLMADVPVTKEDLASLGHGGLCLSCPECTFPNCGFGSAGN